MVGLTGSLTLAFAGLLGCGSSGSGNGSEAGGGASGNSAGQGGGDGGSAGAGGSPSTGGHLGSAGAAGLGGTPGTGGATNAGGSPGAGGSTGSGGGTVDNDAGRAGADAGTRRPDGSAGGRDAGGTVVAADGGANVTIWIAGDSTVANGSAPCPIGWGGQFRPHFDNRVTVVNSAVAGRSVRDWLYSVQPVADATGECIIDTVNGQPVMQQRWIDMLKGMKPGDYLFIQFGINDGDTNCDQARHVGIDAFKQHYGYMAQSAKDRGAQPIFLTPVSAIRCTGTTPVGTRGAYVPATIDAGTQYGVPIIDLHALSIALYASLSFCPIPGGTDVSATTGGAVGAFFCDDHTHFETSGAIQIGNLVATAVQNQQLGLAAYLQ
jgi:lysophospholipase L1-like esterase